MCGFQMTCTTMHQATTLICDKSFPYYTCTCRGFLFFKSGMFAVEIIASLKLPAKLTKLILKRLTKEVFGWNEGDIPLDIKKHWQSWDDVI